MQLFSNIQRLNKDKLNPTYIQIENDGLSSLYGSFTSLYARAKIGDLIIVPNRGYFEPFLLGEIISDFNEEDLLSIYSNEFPTPCRKVRWLPQKKSKCQISESLSNQMSNRKAIGVGISVTNTNLGIIGYKLLGTKGNTVRICLF